MNNSTLTLPQPHYSSLHVLVLRRPGLASGERLMGQHSCETTRVPALGGCQCARYEIACRGKDQNIKILSITDRPVVAWFLRASLPVRRVSLFGTATTDAGGGEDGLLMRWQSLSNYFGMISHIYLVCVGEAENLSTCEVRTYLHFLGGSHFCSLTDVL